jgi:hypothetical protein
MERLDGSKVTIKALASPIKKQSKYSGKSHRQL